MGVFSSSPYVFCEIVDLEQAFDFRGLWCPVKGALAVYGSGEPY